MVPPLNGSIQTNPAPHVPGLKLLQLQIPPLSQQSVPHYLLTQRPAEESRLQLSDAEKRSVTSIPIRQISYNQPHALTTSRHEPQIQASRRARGQEFNIVHPALLPHTPERTQTLRLLQVHPAPHSHITFPKLPIPTSPPRPSAFIAAPMGETPSIKLLHMECGPKMVSNSCLRF